MPIKAIITGSTGMVGKAVLLECLESPEVESVLLINRHPLGMQHPKIKEIIRPDFFNLTDLREEFSACNACYFCLGVSSVGMKEPEFSRLTFDLTLHFARICREANPDMVFCYVSGTGTDSSEQGRVMWARVKGKTENALFKLGFKDAYAFRPGLILPEKGIRSRTGWYQTAYSLLRPFFPLLKKLSSVTTSSRVGRAMIAVTLQPTAIKHLENRDINRLGGNQAV